VGKIDKMSLLSMANGAIRPAGFSYRDKMCDGEFNDNGHPALNELLKDTMGFLVYQEDVLNFLHQFCGYTMGMADLVRRGFAKKSGTEQFIPEIKSGFIKTMKEKYGVSEEESEKLIESFLTVIEDASSYLFSLNHSYPYSIIGYMCAYLRYYYKLEYLTTLLNINKKNIEKSAEIIEYAKRSKILVKAPKFRFSKDDYFFDKETRIIYKNIDSIKFVSGECSEQLYSIKDLIFDDFVDLLIYVEENLKVNSRQMETLIKIGFFDEFGKNETLFIIYETFSSGEFKYNKKLKQETKDKRLKAIRNHALQLKNVSFPVLQQIQFEQDILGYISTTYPIDKRYVFVQSVDTRFAPRVEVYCLANGKTNSLKIQKRTYDNNLFYGGEILYCKHFIEKNAVKFVDGKYIEDEKANKVWWLDSYSVINPEDFDQILQNSIDKK
jgi:DNA polymerase-3 subunit alpha